jgi:hypothetical protein
LFFRGPVAHWSQRAWDRVLLYGKAGGAWVGA